MRERRVKADIRLALGNGDVRLFNNPVGVAIYEGGARVEYGLVPGASDLIGWSSKIIDASMVGQRVAIFTAIETKGERGRKQDNQKTFINAVLEAGGLAGFARTVDEAKKITGVGGDRFSADCSRSTPPCDGVATERKARSGRMGGAQPNARGLKAG